MKSSSRIVVYFVSILILAFSFGARIWLLEPDVALPKNQKVTLVATIKSEPKISYDQQVIEVGDGRVYASMFPKYHVGDKLRIEGKTDETGRIFNAKVEKVGQATGFMYRVAGIRLEIAERINRILPSREATLVTGSVLGVDNIDSKFRDQLIKTGTIHVVVVSGQNLMIVAGIFMAFSKQIGRRFSLLLSVIAVFLYAILSGFEPPVVRASLMVLASSLAIFWGRESVALLNLLVAALIILFVWPNAIFEVSFQLTFAASLGIMTLGQKLSRVFRRLPIIGENAAIATSAFLFTAPIIFYHFQRISLLSPIANVLVVEAVAPIMILGFLIAVFSLIFMPLAQLLAYFAFVPAFYFVKVVEIFSNL